MLTLKNMAYSAGVAILISLLAGLATVVGGGLSLLLVRYMKPVTFAAALAFAAGCTLTVAFADVLPEGLEAWNAARSGGASSDEEDDKNSAVGLLVMLAGWLLASGFDKVLHASLDAYDHWTGAEDHIHVGVCAHDHGHDHSHSHSQTGIYSLDQSAPMMELPDALEAGHDSISSHSHDAQNGDNAGFLKKLGHAIFRIFVGSSSLTPQEQRAINMQFRSDAKKISRLGYFTACVLALHNIPEGIALYGTLTVNQSSGLGLAVAISLHNLPQGMAVAVPIFIGLNSYWKALLFSLAAALAQPLGALLGFGIVGTHPSDNVMCVMLLLTSGVLFNASLKELYGSAVRYDRGNQVCGSFMFIGMLVLSATLIGLAYL